MARDSAVVSSFWSLYDHVAQYPADVVKEVKPLSMREHPVRCKSFMATPWEAKGRP